MSNSRLSKKKSSQNQKFHKFQKLQKRLKLLKKFKRRRLPKNEQTPVARKLKPIRQRNQQLKRMLIEERGRKTTGQLTRKVRLLLPAEMGPTNQGSRL